MPLGSVCYEIRQYILLHLPSCFSTKYGNRAEACERGDEGEEGHCRNGRTAQDMRLVVTTLLWFYTGAWCISSTPLGAKNWTRL